MGSSRAGSNPARSEICFVGAVERNIPHVAAFHTLSDSISAGYAHLDEARIDFVACRCLQASKLGLFVSARARTGDLSRVRRT